MVTVKHDSLAIMPAWNEAAVIGSVIEEVLRVAGDKVDVLVVSDGSTDATARIAREAGVSQAYVVRAFGSKTKLIRTLCEQASTHIEELFRDTAPLSDPGQRREFSKRFQELAFSSDELRLLAQLFVCGTDEKLGPLAREGFTRVAHLLHDDLGIPREETRSLLAVGMLATTLSALDYDRPADPLVEYLFTGEAPLGDDSTAGSGHSS